MSFPVIAILMVQPWRNGSVFDVLMCMCICDLAMCISVSNNVVCASKVFIVGDVNSEALRNPKNAVTNAAHNMHWSLVASA